jgi:NADPH:quinone reductase-like Zn-dependent oxidoreductase
MQAVVFEQFGEPAEVLSVRDVTPPMVEPGQVFVRMLAAPVNPSELMVVRGIYGKLPELPATPGFEGVGVVESAGGGLYGKLLVGKRVAVLNAPTGSWCEQTVLPAKQAIPLPDDLSVEQAAMFFVNPAAAFIMTRKVLVVPQGEWLLQTAAGSALGRMVVRLGKRFGFRTLCVVRRETQVAELTQLGADAVVVFDPTTDDAVKLRAAVDEKTNGRGVQYAIDPVGGATGSAVVECLGRGGRMLVFGTLADEPLSFSSRALMTPGAQIEGFWLANWMAKQGLIGKLRLVKQVKGLMREGILVSDVSESFPLERVTDAVTAAEQPGRGGKVLLRIGDA